MYMFGVFVAVSVFILFPDLSFQKSLQLPLLDDEKASLFVDINMSKVKAYIDKVIASEVQTVINKRLTSSIKHHTSNLLKEIEGLKSNATKREKAVKDKFGDFTTELNAIKELQKRNRPKCQSGTYGHHSGNPTFSMETYIKFDPPFPSKPEFVYGMRLLDLVHGVRANAEFSDLTKTGVKLRLKTWANTKMYGLGISWMACP